mgnify:CR=1 FL=1
MSYNIINPQSASEDVCSICLDNLNNEQIYKLPECGHQFHTNCIFHWLRCGHNKCPYCNNTGLTNSVTDDTYGSSYSYYNEDQYNVLRRFSRNKNAPSELKILVQQLKKLELKLQLFIKQLKEINHKKGVFKELHILYNKKQTNIYQTRTRIRRLKKTICQSTNITPLILIKKKII